MDLDVFKIDLKGLPEGLTPMSFDLDDDYFQQIGATEVNRGRVHVDLEIDRSSKLFNLHVHTKGTVVVSCDRCLDDMDLPVESDDRIEAKLGDGDSDDEDLLAVDEEEGILDLSWTVYEFIALAIPVRHVHAPGKCNPAMIRVLEQHSATRSGVEGEEATDPRWAALRKLKEQ